MIAPMATTYRYQKITVPEEWTKLENTLNIAMRMAKETKTNSQHQCAGHWTRIKKCFGKK